MKPQFYILLFTLIGTATYLFQNKEVSFNLRSMNTEQEIYKSFVDWKLEFAQNFIGKEDQYRFEMFKQNFLYAKKVNSDTTSTLRLGMNQFAAMSNEEFRKIMLIPAPRMVIDNKKEAQEAHFIDVGVLPTSVNWVTAGAVTPVENQGQCGSCWSFSAKEGLEGIYQIQTKNLVVFSSQQIMDCSTANHGCQGGEPYAAYQYTAQYGIEPYSDYPYVSGTGIATPCTYNAANIVFKNTGQQMVTPNNNAAAIQAAVVNQPVSIELDGGSNAFQLYKSGILTAQFCGTQLDHAILLVGYNTAGTTPYWIVKNSWGTTWGENGYAQIGITPTGPGICGVQQYVAFPTWTQ